MDNEMPDKPGQIMVISPHPDDIDFGCNGTIDKWTRQGREVVYVICTSGDKGTDNLEMKPETLAGIREEEQRAAAMTVGVKNVDFLRLKDGELENTPDFRRLIVKMIRHHRPAYVISMDPANNVFENPYVSHRDHRETAVAVFDAIYPAARNHNFFPELLAEGLMPHSVLGIFFFATPHPNIWIDISETMESKINALQCHTSQIGDSNDLVPWLRERHAAIGKSQGFAYGEAFRYMEFPI